MKNAYFSLVLAAVLYGSISTIAKPSLNSINPVLLSSLIYLIIGISLTAIIKISTKNIPSISKDLLKLILFTSVCGAVIGPILYFYGLKLTDASFASLLINTEFLFSILLAISILKEKPTRMVTMGVLLIFVGLIIVNMNSISEFSFFKNNNNSFVGNILIIGATVFWALDNNISNIILQKEIPVIRIIQLKSLFGGLLSLLIGFLFALPFTIGIYQIPSLLLLSLGGFAGSLFLFLNGMKKVGTIKSVMIFSTSSIFGIIFALIFLNEHVEMGIILSSLALMMIGIFLIVKNDRSCT